MYENDNAVPAADCPFTPGRDRWWQSEVAAQPTTCAPEWVEAEHPLFLLYTSGSTGACMRVRACVLRKQHIEARVCVYRIYIMCPHVCVC